MNVQPRGLKTRRFAKRHALLLLAGFALVHPANSIAASVDIEGTYPNNPADTIGTDNEANMTGDTTLEFWGEFSFPLPVNMNSHLLTIDSGGGNPVNLTGTLSGDGDLNLIGAAHWAGTWNVPIQIGGDTDNTFTGTTTVTRGTLALAKNGATAIPGDLVVGSETDTGRVVWTMSNQIADSANVTLIYYFVSFDNAGRETYLDLAGNVERINELRMDEGTYVKTGVGGILNVERLFIDGVELPSGAYTTDSGFVQGSGYIDVGDFGPPVITDPPGEPTIPVPSDFSSDVQPAALTKLEWSPAANTQEYEVFLWTEDEEKPEWPTAVVPINEFTLPFSLESLTLYYWQVVAQNVEGSTESEVWSFETVDRQLISGEIVNPNQWIGFDGSATLIGDAIFSWQTNFTEIPIQLAGHRMTFHSGDGNPFTYMGNIAGEGELILQHAPFQSGLWNAEMVIGGDVGNDYSGLTWARYGSFRLEKTSGNALAGIITVGAFDNSARIIWAADDQIADESSMHVMFFDVAAAGYPERGTFLNLNGHSDTIARLVLEQGTYLDTGSGGELTITEQLTLGSSGLEAGVYTNATHPDYIKGSGSIVALAGSASEDDAFDRWAISKGLFGDDALFDTEPDGDGVSNAVKFVVGGEPGTNSRGLLPTVEADGDMFVITFTRAFESAYLDPKIEFGTELHGEWTVASDPENASIETISGVSFDTVVVRIPMAGNPAMFARLKVVRP